MLQKSIHNLQTRCMIYRFDPTHTYLGAKRDHDDRSPTCKASVYNKANADGPEILRLNWRLQMPFKLIFVCYNRHTTMDQIVCNEKDNQDFQCPNLRPAVKGTIWTTIPDATSQSTETTGKPLFCPSIAFCVPGMPDTTWVAPWSSSFTTFAPNCIETCLSSAHRQLPHAKTMKSSWWLVHNLGWFYGLASDLHVQIISSQISHFLLSVCQARSIRLQQSNQVRLPGSNRRTSSAEHCSACKAAEMIGTWRANWYIQACSGLPIFCGMTEVKMTTTPSSTCFCLAVKCTRTSLGPSSAKHIHYCPLQTVWPQGGLTNQYRRYFSCNNCHLEIDFLLERLSSFNLTNRAWQPLHGSLLGVHDPRPHDCIWLGIAKRYEAVVELTAVKRGM